MALTPSDDQVVDRIVARLTPSSSLLFITGAGMSADSGLPTYRGVGGLYSNRNRTEHGCSIEEALSGLMMEVRPDVTWAHLLELERTCRGATFNRGHAVLAEMERHFERLWVLTQNVDGFHQRAGSRNVIEIHGNLRTLRCTRSRCGHRSDVETFADLKVPPRCPCCNGILRPDVVLFGEMIPAGKLDTLDRELERGFDLVFSVGTSSPFPYIVAPVHLAKEQGAPTVEINPGRTEISGLVDLKITARAAETLDALWGRYRERSPERRPDLNSVPPRVLR